MKHKKSVTATYITPFTRNAGGALMHTTYDPKCHALAAHFLSDYRQEDCKPGREIAQLTVELAREIQRAIDEFLTDEGLI